MSLKDLIGKPIRYEASWQVFKVITVSKDGKTAYVKDIKADPVYTGENIQLSGAAKANINDVMKYLKYGEMDKERWFPTKEERLG
jgi:hypothetical protein